MYGTLHSRLTTGVAFVGAGAIAFVPVVAPPPPFERTVAQSVFSDGTLLATTNPMVDLSGSFNGLLGGLATALNLDVTLDANGGVSLPDFVGALIAGGAAMMPAGVMETIAQLVGDPIRFGLGALMTGNDALSGLLVDGIDTFPGVLGDALTTSAGFLAGSVTTGSQMLGALFIRAADLLTTGTARLVALAAPFATLPIIGPAIVAFGDVLTGFARAGATFLIGIGNGMAGGGGVVAGLTTDGATTLTNAMTSGPAVLGGAVQTGSGAVNHVLQGFVDAVNTVLPPAASTSPKVASATTLAAVRSRASTTRSAIAALPTPTTDHPSVAATVNGHASQTAKGVAGAIHAGTTAVGNLGKAVTGAVTGKSGSAHATGHATGHVRARAGK